MVHCEFGGTGGEWAYQSLLEKARGLAILPMRPVAERNDLVRGSYASLSVPRFGTPQNDMFHSTALNCVTICLEADGPGNGRPPFGKIVH